MHHNDGWMGVGNGIWIIVGAVVVFMMIAAIIKFSKK